MAHVKYLRYALAAAATLGVFALTGFTNTGDASAPTTATEPKAGAAAPYAPTNSAPYRWQPRYPREDLPCNPPGTWEVYPSPTTNDLTAVDFVDVNNGWACGAGVMLRYQSGTWTEEPGQRTRDYRDLDMVTTTDGWAVGREGTTDIWTVWRWDGSSWNVFQTVTGAIYCIDMVDAGHGWIGGNGYFLRFNGTTWEIGGSAPDIVYDIQMDSYSEGRAVAYNYILRCQNSNWQIETQDTSWGLGSIWMFNRNEGWASGYKRVVEDGLLLKCSGGVWSEYAVMPNTDTISRLYFSDSSHGWAVGWASNVAGLIIFCDGKNWLRVKPDPSNGVMGIKMLTSGAGWVVGSKGIILKYRPNVGIKTVSLGRIKVIFR